MINEDTTQLFIHVETLTQKEFLCVVYKDEHENRWLEQHLCGDKVYNFGHTRYMSYLTPRDILTWFHSDYEHANIIDNDELPDLSHLEGFADVDWHRYNLNTWS